MIEGKGYNGTFIPKSGIGSGHLRIDGPESELMIATEKEPEHPDTEFEDVFGSIGDGRAASLIDCINKGTAKHGHHGSWACVTRYFPNFVVVGNVHIGAGDAVIKSVSYRFQDAEDLIPRSRSFGTIRPSAEVFQKLLEEDHKRRVEVAKKHGWEPRPFEPEIGEHPHLMYYSGVRDITSCEADGVSVHIANLVTEKGATASGVSCESGVTIQLDFSEPKILADALDDLHDVHAFMQLCLGKRKRYLKIEVALINAPVDEEGYPSLWSELHWSQCNVGAPTEPDHTGYPDILIDADNRDDQFSRMLAGWLNSRPTMAEARQRFSTAFFKGGNYAIDRLIGAANMFDLLPDDRAPAKRALDKQTMEALAHSRDAFRSLPPSDARESALSALGRVGSASLRNKVLHRAEIIRTLDPGRFEELHIPCAQAVLCRNHYVHGSKPGFDYQDAFNEFMFLTDTLEFVFAASDLTELGWDFNFWREKRTSLDHPFGAYVRNFSENLQRLKTLLQK